jgi:diguanylate cyclase (GGDEF)-like protein
VGERTERGDKDVRLNWKTTLGLAEPSVPGWSRIRGARAAELVRVFPVICLTNLFNGLALVSTLWSAVPRWQLLTWLGAIIVMMGMAARTAERLGRRLPEPPDPAILRRACWRGSALGLLWAVPPVFFAGTGASSQQLTICLISAATIACAAMTASTVPRAMLLFMAITGAGLTVMMAQSGSPLLALLPAVYTACVAIGGLSLGHGFLCRKVAELALEEKSEVVSLLLREFEHGGADWLWQIDSAKRLHHVSPGLARAAGADIASLEGTPLLRLLAGQGWEDGELSAELKTLVERLNARQSFGDLHVPVPIAGETRWWCLSAAPRRDDRGNFIGFRGVGSDVTEQRRSAEAIDRLARFDGLTGLANRQHLTEALRKSLARAYRGKGRCGLLLIDLDRFKPVNDTLGHPIGDKLLKQVAERLRGLMDENDMAGRLGGDEFAIVLRDLDHMGRITELAEAVVATMARPFDIEGHSIRIGASVGAAIGPKDGRSLEALMRSADLALYRAKDDGRGVARRYEPGMLARAEKRQATEQALREALDQGQFHLVFQPIIDAARGAVQGFEALLRWVHPRLGDIPPREFLPVAEEAGLSARIGEWVIRTACMEAASWPDPIRVAVNLSAEQLHDPQLPAIIVSALSHTGLNAARLELELSEAIFLRDRGSVLPLLDRLRTLGVRIALDDFGTGYASLGYLAQGRFSAIKIDDRFVSGAATGDSECLAIVRGIVAMSHSLGIATTAEGTETAEQHARLRELGCSQIQGHQIAPPMSAESARAMVIEPLRRALG